MSTPTPDRIAEVHEMTDYIADTSFSTTLRAALDQFQKALAKRWRKEVAEKIEQDEFDFPTQFRREVAPSAAGSPWEYWQLPARHHIVEGCSYIEWAKGEQDGSIGSVSCEGATGTTENVELVDTASGQTVVIPPNIECGMGAVLGQIDDWAFGECEHIFYQLPLFDAHDQGGLNEAYNSLLDIGGALGLEKGSGSDSDHTFTAVGDRDMAQKADALAGANGMGQDWWTGWTGLSADRAKSGFFASVVPTINNQSSILGCLANLYAVRSAIIEMGRNNPLHAIQAATKAVDAEVKVTHDNVAEWKILQGIGSAIAISGGWTVVGGAVGASIALIGFAGENLLGKTTTVEYAQELSEIVGGLNDKVEQTNNDLADREAEYAVEVNELRTEIHGVHSFNLELYDLTENSPEGDARGEDGYTATVENILKIAQACYECGEIYEELLPRIGRVPAADASLSDKDGEATSADTNLIEARDELIEFVKTACGRLYLAGDQVTEAADAYAVADDGSQDAFDRIMDDWEDESFQKYDVDAKGYAGDTERNTYDPHEGHPALGGSEAGHGQETDYETELS
ncbi:hypothetical protein [Glycomyces arizonensis]|uniref:hypothetical protein n=1 Tax=Glycomyces arizonensis TaxID=256035 RepID=UPI001B7FC1C8|nr:hypothetical protein [Glycomyces arizonensis]